MYEDPRQTSLEHYGVKGMKWGRAKAAADSMWERGSVTQPTSNLYGTSFWDTKTVSNPCLDRCEQRVLRDWGPYTRDQHSEAISKCDQEDPECRQETRLSYGLEDSQDWPVCNEDRNVKLDWSTGDSKAQSKCASCEQECKIQIEWGGG